MNRVSLFLKLYRKKFSANTILFLLFSLLATVISMVLFVQNNNTSLFQSQLMQSGFISEWESQEIIEGFFFAYQSSENILGIIAVAAIFIGAIGGLSLIGFRNQSSEKSIVMMHVFGMQKKDLVLKAFIDAAFYAFLSSCIGYGCGYLLFVHFSEDILQSEVALSFISLRSIAVLCKTFGLVAFIVLCGNLYIDFRMTEKSIAQVLFQRKGSGEGNNYQYILAVEILGIVIYALLVQRFLIN